MERQAINGHCLRSYFRHSTVLLTHRQVVIEIDIRVYYKATTGSSGQGIAEAIQHSVYAAHTVVK